MLFVDLQDGLVAAGQPVQQQAALPTLYTGNGLHITGRLTREANNMGDLFNLCLPPPSLLPCPALTQVYHCGS